MSLPEFVTVVDASDLPRGVVEELSCFYEASNDSYHRYYPAADWDYVEPELKEKINARLKELGVSFPESLEHFHVLLHFNW